jgi:hypothetical protein
LAASRKISACQVGASKKEQGVLGRHQQMLIQSWSFRQIMRQKILCGAQDDALKTHNACTKYAKIPFGVFKLLILWLFYLK